MNIIAFQGSPRKDGNTARIIKKILLGAESAGAESEIIHINDYQIKGCQGCCKCYELEKCAVKDDMQELYRKIDKADYIIFGSPVYMWQITGQMKILIDRLYPYLGFVGNKEYNLKSKKAITVFTQGWADNKRFGNYFEHINGVIGTFGMEIVGELRVGGLVQKTDIEEKEDILKAAEELGKTLIRKG